MMVSVRDVALRAGVSIGTVSNVLNRPDKVSAETARRVNAAIRELGFVRNDAARQLRAGSSHTIGLVMMDASNPFYTDVARGAEGAAETEGSAILIADTNQDVAREMRYLDLFAEQRVQGVIITPIGNITPPLARLQERGTPVVLVDRLAGLDRFSSVSVDDVLGGRLAARHLIEQGRKRIAFVGPTDLEQFAGRRRGARLAVEQTSGVSFEQIATPVPSFLAGRQAAERILHRAPARRPDGICTVNDLVALGILQELLVAGVRVPEEIAVIGYDDIAFAGSAVVALSSIRQPRELLGRTGVELLLEEAREGTNFAHRHVVFQPELVARASTIGAAADQPRTSD